MKFVWVIFSAALLLFIAAVILYFTGAELPGHICIACGCTLIFIWVALLANQISRR